MENRKVKLIDVCTQIFAGGDVPKDRCSDTKTTEYPIPIYANAEKDNGLYGYTDVARVEEDCVTVAARGTIGYTAIRREPFLPVVRLITVIPNQEIIKIEYLYYALRHLKPKSSGTSIPQLTVPDIKKYSFKIAPINQQGKIIKTLEMIEGIIIKKKEELGLLDDIIKSRFVELFGDPISNPMKWDKYMCKKIMSKIGSGATPRGGDQSYKDEGISLIRSMNVHNGRFEYKNLAFIDDEQSEKLKNVTIEESDVLLNITGASVARCCLIPSEIIPARVNQHVSILRCKDKVAPVFINQQLINSSFQAFLLNIATSNGATREAITKLQLEELEVIVPPKQLQDQFVDFVKSVDKLKLEVQKSLDETQILFDSLMQVYFE